MSDFQKVHHILDKRMIMPIIVIILLLITAIVLYSYMTSTEEEIKGRLAEEGMVEQVAVAESAVEPARPTYCQELVESGEYADEESCFVALSDQNYNHEYCFGITDIAGRDACLKLFVNRTLRPEACLALSDEADVAECLFNTALARDELDPCFDIPYRNGEFSENHCIFEIAKKESNTDICGFLSTGEEPRTIEGCIAAIVGSEGA